MKLPAFKVALGALALWFAGGFALASAADRPPNFLFILGDNLGKDWIGCYGADGGHTPNVDKLAANGVRFAHWYTTPLCSTTRVQLMTGRYGFRTGWHTHHDSAMFAQYATTRIVRDRQFKLFSTGGFFDIRAYPLEKSNLAASAEPEVIAAKRRLQQVLDELPPDAKLPFEFRNGSAFKLQANGAKAEPRPRP